MIPIEQRMAGLTQSFHQLLSSNRKSVHAPSDRTPQKAAITQSTGPRKERVDKIIRNVVSKDDGSGSTRRLWVPFVLRRKGMILFWGVFVALLATLVSLYISSNRNHGLVTVKQEDLHYLWTYGPTAGGHASRGTCINLFCD